VSPPSVSDAFSFVSSFSALSLFAIAPAQSASFMGLGWLPNTSLSYATGVSADGSVVVGSSENSINSGQAFRWTKVDGMVGLGSFDENVLGSGATSVSADGTVVVEGLHGDSHTNSFFYPVSSFLWTQETGMVGLSSLGNSEAKGVSADGSIIIGSSNGQAFRWTQETGMVGLGTLGFSEQNYGDGQKIGTSADGSIIVGTSVNQAFRWTQNDTLKCILN
jgi:probable HAF family extracellular repeat protein